MITFNRTVLVAVLCVLAQTPLGFAGIRSTGKYAGIPIFDRWDGCTLYSGVFVMYVSEKVKEDLRPYAGQAVLIDAKQVYQPRNPGDGRIGRFKYLGPATEKRNWVVLSGITLTSFAELDAAGKIVATLSIKNTGKDPVKLSSQELALTLLTKRSPPKHDWFVADGPSYALITRTSFGSGSSEPRWQVSGIAGGKPYSWTIEKVNALPHDFTLGPNETRSTRIHFDLPPGEYDFLCGYGGGVHEWKCLASNLTAFDIGEDGKGNAVISRTIATKKIEDGGRLLERTSSVAIEQGGRTPWLIIAAVIVGLFFIVCGGVAVRYSHKKRSSQSSQEEDHTNEPVPSD